MKTYRRGVLAICLSFVAVFTSSSFLFADVSHDYPSHDEMVAEMFALKSSAPDYVQIGEIGKSVQGRPIYFFKISRPGEKAKSEALVAANIHGNEWIGNRVAMSMAKRILRDKASDPWISSLLDDVDFWFLPCINPDGYVRTWEELDNDDAEWAHMRKNANGVDLNRNFPLPAERTVDMDLAGSNDPAHIRYMGPYPYSE
ncbi:MAG TPA: M14 family metallopeptidase, partial [bacterium]|nr:M14 family metallopeptidase [bacterium]